MMAYFVDIYGSLGLNELNILYLQLEKGHYIASTPLGSDWLALYSKSGLEKLKLAIVYVIQSFWEEIPENLLLNTWW